MIIPLNRIVKISAKAVHFARFCDQVLVEGRKPMPVNGLPQNLSSDAHRRMIPGQNLERIPGIPGGVQIQMNSMQAQSTGYGMNVTTSSTWASVRPTPIPASRKKPIIGPIAPLPPGIQLKKPRPYPARQQHVVSQMGGDDPKMTREEQIDDFRRFSEAFDKQWLSGFHRGNSWIETRFPVKSSDLKKVIRSEMKPSQIASSPNACKRTVDIGGTGRGRRDKKEDHAMHSTAGENRGSSTRGDHTAAEYVEEPLDNVSRRTNWCARIIPSRVTW